MKVSPITIGVILAIVVVGGLVIYSQTSARLVTTRTAAITTRDAPRSGRQIVGTRSDGTPIYGTGDEKR